MFKKKKKEPRLVRWALEIVRRGDRAYVKSLWYKDLLFTTPYEDLRGIYERFQARRELSYNPTFNIQCAKHFLTHSAAKRYLSEHKKDSVCYNKFDIVQVPMKL